MLDAVPRSFRNQLLSGFTKAQLVHLVPHLEPMELPLRLPLQAPDEPIEYVYFLASGITSIVVTDSRGKHIEAELFGRRHPGLLHGAGQRAAHHRGAI